MNKEEILQFLQRKPVCHLATMEGNQPHADGGGSSDSTGIIFHTGAFKFLSNQIAQNKQVRSLFQQSGHTGAGCWSC